MPLFEFVCIRCKKEFEELVRNDEKPRCPDCGSGDVKKKLSSFSSPNASGGSACSSCSATSCSSCGAGS